MNICRYRANTEPNVRAKRPVSSVQNGVNSYMDASSLPEGGRWSCRRKLEIVQRIIAGEPIEDVSMHIGVPISQLEDWRDKALAGMEAALKTPVESLVDHQLKVAQRRISALSMENELLYERCRLIDRPFPQGRSRK